MATEKRVRCHGCGQEFETDAESIFVSCPNCGMSNKVNKRWEPEGAQYVTDTVPFPNKQIPT